MFSVLYKNNELTQLTSILDQDVKRKRFKWLFTFLGNVHNSTIDRDFDRVIIRSVRTSTVLRKWDSNGRGPRAAALRCPIPAKVIWAAKWSGHGIPSHPIDYSALTCLVKEGIDRLGSSNSPGFPVLLFITFLVPRFMFFPPDITQSLVLLL